MTVLRMPSAANVGPLPHQGPLPLGRELLESALAQLERAAKAKAYDSPLREAAFIVAVERVASAITKRGIFP